MDENKTDGSPGADGPRRSDKPLGRGLEDVSHLFLSQKAGEAAAIVAVAEATASGLDRTGGLYFSIERICTFDVCVRSRYGVTSRKNVSCVSRAG